MENEIDFNHLKTFSEKYNIEREIIQRVKIISELTLLREKANLTQKELGNKIGLTQAQISKIEKGRTSPTLDTLLKIVNFFQKELTLSN